MKEQKTIYLNSLCEVQDFVNSVEHFDFPITARSSDMRINAKAFMAMVSQATGRKVIIEYAKRDRSLDLILDKYAV